LGEASAGKPNSLPHVNVSNSVQRGQGIDAIGFNNSLKVWDWGNDIKRGWLLKIPQSF